MENACGPSDPTPWGNQGPSYASRARETLQPEDAREAAEGESGGHSRRKEPRGLE